MHLTWLLVGFLISGLEAVPLIMSVTRKINMLNESDTDDLTTGNHIVAVDYHLARGEIYFSDLATGQIFRTLLSPFESQKPSVIAEIKVSDGLAVDWIHDNIYWTDTVRVTVEVATLDGLYRKVLFNATHGLQKPRAIVLDPKNGVLFWSDWGDDSRVNTAGLDGKKMKTIVSSNIYWPNGLTLDLSKSKLYILDGFLSTLSSCNYDGSQVTVLSRSPDNFQQGFGLTYYANTLYWNSWRHRALFKMNIDELQRETVLQVNGLRGILERMMGLKAVHASLQPALPQTVQDPCSNSNSQCTHHCLVGRDLTPTCICAFGYKLAADGKTCIEEGYLLVSWRLTINRLSMDGHDLEPLIDTTKAAISLGYHFKKGLVFWSDVMEHKIYRAPLDQLNNKSEVASPHTCDGLTVDWVHDVIYWTDTEHDTVEAAQLDGSKHLILFDTDLDKPRDIAVDPLEGLLFWTDWGDTPKIERSTLNGKERKVIIDYDHIWPNGITLDIPSKQIYYVDGKIGTIYKTSYDGSHREVVFLSSPTTSLHLFAITLLNNELYWTDWQSRSLYTSPKYNITVAKQLFTSKHILLTPNGIKAVHSSLQPTKENPCAKVNCKNLCLGTKYQTAVCMGEEEKYEPHDATPGNLQFVKTIYNDSITITMAEDMKLAIVLVDVRCLGRGGCPDDVPCFKKPISPSTKNRLYLHDTRDIINITDLLPASHYEIEVTLHTSPPEVRIFNITTLATDPPETPYITSVDKQGSSVTVKWDPVDKCFPSFNSYNYKLFKTGAEDNNTQEGRTNLTQVTFENLELEVSYTVHVYTTNPQYHSSITFNLEKECQDQNLFCDGKEDCADGSDEDVKLCAAIEKMVVYKKSNSEVYLRVDVTNGTVNRLDKFIVSYSSEKSDKTEQMEIPAEPCLMWPESYCLYVSSLERNKVYDFKISVSLKGGKIGNKYSVSTITKEEASGPPENVRVIKHNATCLIYQWTHPNQSNGIIKSFLISIDETEAFEEDKCCQALPIISLPAPEEELLYETSTSSLTPASSYAISITAKNKYVGTPATLTVNTPPPPMEVIRMPQVEVSSVLPLSWKPQDEQGELPLYHSLVRSYMLLLFPPKTEPLTQPEIKNVEDDITEILQTTFGDRYIVLWDKKVEDTDAFKSPIKVDRLTALKQYKLAWVQVAQYKDSHSIDYLESDPFITV